MSFTTGAHGGMFQDHMAKNRDSHLDFSRYNAGEFSVGFQGGQYGTIVDLGSPEELQRQYGYEETVNGGQGFASIRIQDGKLVILDDYSQQSTQALLDAEALYEDPESMGHALVQDNHVYIVRLRDRNDQRFDRFVKFLVVQHAPGVSVTLRWHAVDVEGAS